MSIRFSPTDIALDDGGRALRRLLLVVGAACLVGVVPFLSGLVGALMLYVLVRPVHTRLARVIPSRVSAFLLAIAVFVLVLVPAGWLVGRIAGQAAGAVRTWDTAPAIAWLSRTPLRGLDLAHALTNASSSVLSWLSTRAFALFGSVTTTVLNTCIALFGFYYLPVGARPLWVRARRLLPVPASVADQLADRFVEVTEALVLGTMLTAMLQGLVVGLAFAVLGLQPAALWGFVTACVSVLPLLGSAIVWLPGAGVLLLDHRPVAALLLTLIGAAIASNLDNVVRLFVYRRVSGIHPMLTLVGAFAGVRFFGIVGAVIGPLVLSYFFELLGFYEEATAADAHVPRALTRELQRT